MNFAICFWKVESDMMWILWLQFGFFSRYVEIELRAGDKERERERKTEFRMENNSFLQNTTNV